METIAQININKLVFPQQQNASLKNINLQINKGDFIVITGDVASGKSILLHTITGAIPHYHDAELTGEVFIMGKDIKDIPLNKMSQYLGYMMQDTQNQLISLNVYEDIAFGLGNLGMHIKQIEETVKRTLEFVGLKGYENRQTTSLSGGEAQRVVLAGVLALGSPILILDQPTADLDPQGRSELYTRLRDLNKTQNITIILVMDRIEEVISYANRVLYMKDGEITKQYPPEKYIKLRNYHLNKKLENTYANMNSNAGKEIIVKVDAVSYNYKNDMIGCKDINLEIYKGDFLSILGLNGSGKSTLAKLIIGLLKPTNGEVYVFNQALINKKNLAKVRSQCGFLFQNPDYQIFASTLEEEVGFSLKLRGVQKEIINSKTHEALKFVGLLDYKNAHPQQLSRGQRQLLALASILASDPKLIITDEPTSGLDEDQGYMIMDKLEQLSRNGTTVLMITHDLTMAIHYSNRLVTMHNHHIKLDILTRDLHKHVDSFKEIGLNVENTLLYREV